MAAQKRSAQAAPKQGVAAGRLRKKPATKKTRAPRKAASSRTNTNVQQNSPLLNLPAELRNEIYDLALTPPADSRLDISKPKLIEPGLLLACKQTRREASPLFYANNALYGTIRNLDFDIVVHRLRRIHRLGIQTVDLIDFRIIGQYGQRRTLKPLLPFVQLFADTGIELKAPEGCDLYSWGPEVYRGTHFAHIIEAQEMCTKAYKEGWSQEMLEDQFVQWVDDREKRKQVWT
ncbi:hypothetical protein LTR85_011436 [Meristemomyces frigidus]|nr:hypothetical protein LTR85_011436 [Meristemomyces frigidus]